MGVTINKKQSTTESQQVVRNEVELVPLACEDGSLFTSLTVLCFNNIIT